MAHESFATAPPPARFDPPPPLVVRRRLSHPFGASLPAVLAGTVFLCARLNAVRIPFWRKGAFGLLPKYWQVTSTTC